MGDFNARHLSWGDKVINYYGRGLAESLDSTRYSICTSQSPTFLCSNGSSFIDLAIISNNLVESVTSCVTDEGVELFSGAPTRGHVPLLMELKVNCENVSSPVVEKLDLTKMKWEEWTKHIENSIEEDRLYLATEENRIVYGIVSTTSSPKPLILMVKLRKVASTANPSGLKGSAYYLKI